MITAVNYKSHVMVFLHFILITLAISAKSKDFSAFLFRYRRFTGAKTKNKHLF